ncbi:type II toxin-antitoxin system RatA family toxin [Phenylobacterium sp.]|uniref:type II toxin-antitoxin system RatA family toxin n=1 Tax=Phenylobacterium sp. TaxID=1871053 RepID=UPI00262F192E|nr:type II toxin-antitoxin system RatA family toxin [Phenylobacterium sp.]
MRHRVTKVLPYGPDQLFALVGDVDRYPEFVPWITGMRTWNQRPVGAGVDMLDAEAAVGFSFLKERFSTRVRRDANTRTIQVGLISGPFKRLENRWRFHDDPAGTKIEFEIDFEFKSRLLATLLSANFHHAVDRLIGCFEARAGALYGPPAAGDAPPA